MVLAVRGIGGRSLQNVIFAIAALVIILISILYSLIRTFRDMPPLDSLRAVFDKINNCGGLLMTASETPLGQWAERVSDVQSPRLIWRGRRLSLIVLSAIAFMAISFLVPQRYIAAGTAGRLEITEQTEQLKQQVEVLEEEDILAEEVAEDVRRQIDLVQETAVGRDPVKTWEAMGHLQDQLKKAAEEAAVEMLAETEELTQAETLAQALDQMGQMGEEMDAEAMAGAMSELAKAVQAMLEQNEALQEALQGRLDEAIEAGQLSEQQLKELMEALQGRKLELTECMGELCEADLADLKYLKLCQGKGEGDGEGLMLLLAGCEGFGAGQDAASMFIMKTPGWGINRGRGDAPMIWSDPSSKEGTAFKEQLLPPARMAAMKDSELVGVSLSAPSLEEGSGNLDTGSLSSGQAGSGQAVKRVILPKHKAAVKGYFDRDTEE
ncbi:MAG: hypothetical protein ACYTER_02180 [Planctomycetota bacterium]